MTYNRGHSLKNLLLAVVLLVGFAGQALAQRSGAGIFSGPSMCSDLVGQVTAQSYCFDWTSGSLNVWNGSAWAALTPSVATSSAGPMKSTVGFNFAGPVPASSVSAFTCATPLTIPANFASPNSVLTCGTNPAESDAYTVRVNGVTVGTLTISTTCTITRSASAATTCSAGQRMEIDAPFTVSGSDIAISIGVTR